MVTCFDHVAVLGAGPKSLHLRFSDEALDDMLRRVKTRSDKAGKVGPSLLGAPEPLGETRKSGRKRIPSTLLLEASGIELPPASRRKTSHANEDTSSSSRYSGSVEVADHTSHDLNMADNINEAPGE